ncbi:MAG: hypothetical protein EA387_09660 [Nitriliruptor sp.]|nr:MAG: hypothetical protein EA387_09660 [Nitriliruptor sp.]
MNGPTIKPPRATMGPETRSMMGKDRCSDGPLLRNGAGRRTTTYNVQYLAVALYDRSRNARVLSQARLGR